MIRPPRHLLALAALAAPLAAQDQQGPLVGQPLVLIAGAGSFSPLGPVPDDELLDRPAGFGPVDPVAPPLAPGAPSFEAKDIWGDGISPPPFTVNAYSIGLDEVLATAPSGGQSLVDVPPFAWGAVEFSVTSDSVGRTGSVVADEAALPGGAGADLFTLMLEGSFLDPSVLGCYPTSHSQKAVDAAELGLAGPQGITPGEVGAVDFYTPLYRTGAPVAPTLDPEPTVYFSVTDDSINPSGGGPSLVPAAWFGPTLPSAGTILETTWNASSGTWRTPMVFIPYSALGLDVTDDIDGLAVDLLRCKLMFSIVETTTSTLAEQLQIATFTKSDSSFAMSIEVGDYVVDDGMGSTESVARRAGLETGDDIDSVCTIDPGKQDGVGFKSYATPALAITPFKTMFAQVYRDEATGLLPTLTTTVSGLPTGPTFPRQTIQLWLGSPFGGGYTILPGPIYVEPLNGSNPSGVRSLSFVDPALGVIAGIPIDFIWVQRPPAPISRSAPAMRMVL